MLASFSGMAEAGGEGPSALEGLSVNSVTGEMIVKPLKDESEAAGMAVAIQMFGGSGLFGGGRSDGDTPVFVRELAGQLVGDARRR
jgi:hypothetical protein